MPTSQEKPLFGTIQKLLRENPDKVMAQSDRVNCHSSPHGVELKWWTEPVLVNVFSERSEVYLECNVLMKKHGPSPARETANAARGRSWQHRQAEAIFGTLGARRVETLGLQSLQQQLLREKGLQLLKACIRLGLVGGLVMLAGCMIGLVGRGT